MEKFVITGGKPLHGEVIISGAKNAAVGILPATILAADVCVIENLPDISDVAVSLKILSVLGAKVRMLNKNTYEIDTTHLTGTNVPDDLSRQMRASYYFLGALLSRFGKAQVAMPGGCQIGARKIDMHLVGLEALGVNSIGLTAIISVFIGAVITLQMCINLDSPFIPRSLVGYATRETMILEFSSAVVALILAGKVGSSIASEILQRAL